MHTNLDEGVQRSEGQLRYDLVVACSSVMKWAVSVILDV